MTQSLDVRVHEIFAGRIGARTEANKETLAAMGAVMTTGGAIRAGNAEIRTAPGALGRFRPLPGRFAEPIYSVWAANARSARRAAARIKL